MIYELLFTHLFAANTLSGYQQCIEREDDNPPFNSKANKIVLLRSAGMPSDKDLSKLSFDVMFFSKSNPTSADNLSNLQAAQGVQSYLLLNHRRETIHNITIDSSLSGPYRDGQDRKYYTMSLTAHQRTSQT